MALINGILTHDLCDGGAMLYQVSYEATLLGVGQFVGLTSSRERTWWKKCIYLKRGLHSLVGRALHRNLRGHGFEFRLEPPEFFRCQEKTIASIGKVSATIISLFRHWHYASSEFFLTQVVYWFISETHKGWNV